MPYTGPNDTTLPDNIKDLPEDQRARWVNIFDSEFEDCQASGGDDCEAQAFRQANGVVLANRLQFISNQTAPTRRETVAGVDYLIAPVVAVKAGELNGETVTEEELGAHVEAWNGRPFVVGHPAEGDVNVSANDPEILAQKQIGRLFNVLMDDGALKGEIWIDLALAASVKDGEEVVGRLENGKQLEVSTAYFRDLAGKEARNLRPDHLAALLDVEGACSWADGCGAPRVNEDKEMIQKSDTDQGNLKKAWVTVTRALGFNQEETSMDELVSAILGDGRIEIAEETLRGFPEAALSLIASLLEATAQEPEVQEDQPTPTPEPAPEVVLEPVLKPVVQPVVNEGCDKLAALAEAMDRRGGAESVLALLDSLQANESERRDKLVVGLVANDQCALDKAQLETLPIDSLEALGRSFIVPDYSGLGGTKSPLVGYTEVEM